MTKLYLLSLLSLVLAETNPNGLDQGQTVNQVAVPGRPDVPVDQGWARFRFGDVGSAVTYNVPKDGFLELTVTDAFCPGDAFWVHLNDGPLLFSTPLVATGDCSERFENADEALASPLFSSGSVCAHFKAGDKISVIVRRNGSGGGRAFIKAKSMPNGCPVPPPAETSLAFSAVGPMLPTAPNAVVLPTIAVQPVVAVEAPSSEEEVPSPVAEEPSAVVVPSPVIEAPQPTLTSAEAPKPTYSFYGGLFGPRPPNATVPTVRPTRAAKPPQPGFQVGRVPQVKKPAQPVNQEQKQPAKQEQQQPAKQEQQQPAKQEQKQPAKQEQKQPAKQEQKQPAKPARAQAQKQPVAPHKQPQKNPQAQKQPAKKETQQENKKESPQPAKQEAQKQPAKQPIKQQAQQQPAKQPVKQQAQKKPARQVIKKPIVKAKAEKTKLRH